MTPAEFLTARYATEEARARALPGPTWTIEKNDDFDYTVCSGRSVALDGHVVLDGIADTWREDASAHIATWDPARVLADVEMKRELLALASAACPPDCLDHGAPEHARDEVMALVMIRTLLRPYRSDPDYRQEWA